MNEFKINGMLIKTQYLQKTVKAKILTFFYYNIICKIII